MQLRDMQVKPFSPVKALERALVVTETTTKERWVLCCSLQQLQVQKNKTLEKLTRVRDEGQSGKVSKAYFYVSKIPFISRKFQIVPFWYRTIYGKS